MVGLPSIPAGVAGVWISVGSLSSVNPRGPPVFAAEYMRRRLDILWYPSPLAMLEGLFASSDEFTGMIPSISLNTFLSRSRFSSDFHAVGPNAPSTPRYCLEINSGRTSF